MELRLGFTTGPCPRCGHIKPVAAQCKDCRQPGVADPLVNRRKVLLENIHEFDPNLEQLEQVEWSAVIRDIKEVWNHIQNAIDAMSIVSAETSSKAQVALHGLARLRARFQITRKYRPLIPSWRMVEQVVNGCAACFDTFIQVFVAQTPEMAQRLQGNIQKALDESTQALANLDRALDVSTQSHGAGSTDGLATMIGRVMSATEHRRYIEVVLPTGETITSQHPLWGDGLVLTSHQLDLLGLDSDRFQAVANKTVALMLKQPQRITSLIEAEVWVDEFRRLTQELRWVGVEAGAILSTSADYKLSTRALIDFSGKLVEGVAGPLIAMLLAIKRGQPYSKLHKRDKSRLIHEARQAGLEELTFGLYEAFRHALAHRYFDITNEGVGFSADRREFDFLPHEAFLDRVLGGLESVLAMHTGITLAILQVHPELIRILDPILASDYTLEERLALATAFYGWSNLEVSEQQGLISIRCSGTESPTSHQLLKIAISLVPYLDNHLTSMHLDVFTPAGLFRCSGLLEPVRTFVTATSPETRQKAIIGILDSWSSQGPPAT